MRKARYVRIPIKKCPPEKELFFFCHLKIVGFNGLLSIFNDEIGLSSNFIIKYAQNTMYEPTILCGEENYPLSWVDRFEWGRG